MALLVVTPLTGLFRKVTVYELVGSTEAQMFEAFQAVNAGLTARGVRSEVNVSLVPVTLDQLGDWLALNIHPNWFQKITRRVSYTVHTMARN